MDILMFFLMFAVLMFLAIRSARTKYIKESKRAYGEPATEAGTHLFFCSVLAALGAMLFGALWKGLLPLGILAVVCWWAYHKFFVPWAERGIK